MRINQFIAQATGLSRRAADQAVKAGRVRINGQPAQLGEQLSTEAAVTLDGKPLTMPLPTTTIILNKPAGYVVSRKGQGSSTIYELLPAKYHHVKPVGRLDKDSSGLLLLTNDGALANQLTHPRYGKTKIYEIKLDKPLAPTDVAQLQRGVKLSDGVSKLQIKPAGRETYTVTMREGRNRQIRRSLAALGYSVTALHRTDFGEYHLPVRLRAGHWQPL